MRRGCTIDLYYSVPYIWQCTSWEHETNTIYIDMFHTSCGLNVPKKPHVESSFISSLALKLLHDATNIPSQYTLVNGYQANP